MLEICQQAGDFVGACETCVTSDGGIWTAIGCINVSENSIATSLLTFVIGVSGGFALLFILIGAFLTTTSAGDPARLDHGKQILTSAVIGLIFIVLSVAILQFIGVTILQLPGF
jgi:hypothetical protein